MAWCEYCLGTGVDAQDDMLPCLGCAGVGRLEENEEEVYREW